jgi:NADH-quinone oxidoreductase subunit L
MNIAAGPAASLAFIFLLIGAMGKGGAMPFHVWIPDAAIDAPLPFMAFMPAALEKLLGIYFLTRITVDMFKLSAGSPLCILLMTVGAITIILAVMMALIQKNYKRLLAYHAISQVGYMILGIGTALPAGIIGGIFHMLNNAMYKSCLFLTAGAVEKQTGTTDLEKLGGLAKKMPVTLACFLITAASISGVPPFNGFFSKELIYDAALERNVIFYLAAIAGTFFTAISFLKLGHSAYFNKNNYEKSTVKEANLFILLPMIIIAALCFLFGVRNDIPINKLINPVLVDKVAEHHFEAKMSLVVITSLVLAAALVSHLFQAHKKGDAVKAVDYIHYAPGLAQIYQLAERKFFDTYEIILKLIGFACRLLYAIDRLIDRFYNDLSVNLAGGLGFAIRKVHTGSYRMYLGWSLAGMFLIMMFLLLKG